MKVHSIVHVITNSSTTIYNFLRPNSVELMEKVINVIGGEGRFLVERGYEVENLTDHLYGCLSEETVENYREIIAGERGASAFPISDWRVYETFVSRMSNILARIPLDKSSLVLQGLTMEEANSIADKLDELPKDDKADGESGPIYALICIEKTTGKVVDLPGMILGIFDTESIFG